jgi:broad specificity phosphatase PhoE
MHVLFIRHGKCALPRAIPEEGTLNALGVEQAKLTGKALVGQGIERLFSSPYPRAMQTALYISRATGLKVEIRHRLHEKSGPGARATRSDIAAKFPQFIIPDDMPEEWWPERDESWKDVYDRVRPVVEEFKSLEGKHERIAAVAHGGANDALIGVWIDAFQSIDDQGHLGSGLAIEQSMFYHHNCAFTLVSYQEGRSRIHYINQVEHLNSLEKRDLFFY